MLYFRVGGGWYQTFRTWDGDGCGVSYTVRIRLWCGIWPVAEVKTEKRQLCILPKSGIVPQAFHFIPKVIMYCIQPNLLHKTPTLGKTLLDRVSDTLNFLYFQMNFLYTEIGLYSNVCVQAGKILWKMWHSKWINLVAQQFVSMFYIGGNPLWHVSDNGIVSYKGAYCMRALLSAVPYNGAH